MATTRNDVQLVLVLRRYASLHAQKWSLHEQLNLPAFNEARRMPKLECLMRRGGVRLTCMSRLVELVAPVRIILSD